VQTSLCWAVDEFGNRYEILKVSIFSAAGTDQSPLPAATQTTTFRVANGPAVTRVDEYEFLVIPTGVRIYKVA
jgi:hypothetical protein